MIDLYIVRHGESVANEQGRIAGFTDVALSNKWILQAQAVREYLHNENCKFDMVYSSPLQRSYNTISDYCDDENYEIICDDRLKELNFWPIENQLISGLGSEEYFEDTFYYSDNGNIETYEQVTQRVRDFLVDNIYQLRWKKILISCHAGVTRAFVAALNELTREVPRLFVPNASITHYKIDELTRIARCEKFGYDMHLRNKDLI